MAGVDPHGLLAHVEPDLAAVIRAAAQEPQPFVVVQGLRSVGAEEIAVSTHHSETMHSRHLADRNGVAAAVDVAAIENGQLSYAPGREAEVFGLIADQIFAAADHLGTDVEWGGDWGSLKDWGHFQLPWSEYP